MALARTAPEEMQDNQQEDEQFLRECKVEGCEETRIEKEELCPNHYTEQLEDEGQKWGEV